jgi:hypothetical protein
MLFGEYIIMPHSKFDLREVPMFVVGVVLLAILLFASFDYPSVQYNIIWMVVLSLSVAIVMAFLPFSAEFTIPSWAKFGGSAAVLIGCMYLTFDLAAKGLEKENDQLRSQVTDLGKQIETYRTAASLCTANANAKDTGGKAKQNILDSLTIVKNNVTQAKQFAFGATTNTSDVRGCTAAAGRSQQASETALAQIEATKKAINELPN